MSESASSPPKHDEQPGMADFARVGTGLLAFAAALWAITQQHGPAPPPQSLLGPVFALTALIGVFWVWMTLVRNYAVLRGIASGRYYRAYRVEQPPDWVERPARVFNNLLQVPLLFYAVCALMLASRQVDHVQLLLGWLFVATRVVHALVYLVWNHVPTRFGLWTAGGMTLAVIWFRFAYSGVL